MHKKRKLKKEIKVAIGIGIVIMSVFAIINTSNKKYHEEVNSDISVSEEEGIAQIPSSVHDEDTIKYLKEFQKRAESDKKYNAVIKSASVYPKDALKLLYNNSETLDFVLSYGEMNIPSIFIRIDEKCGDGNIPALLQWDEKWGYSEYGDGIIAVNGCGPTAVSMVAAGLTGKESITPIKVAKYSDSMGYHESAGTNWNLMSEGVKKFGIKGWKIDNTEKDLKAELEAGHPIICSMGPGVFTREGHFIVIAGIKDGKFVIHDPNSIKNTEKLWDYSEFGDQIKSCWAYSKK
ncbi:hypothetical protein EXD82_02100 [Peptacetobacter hominis]|uniref:Peptidase C39-like domain-containing protein n=1 Tax=Peptacetobacter hominis TaxID=2743610 RepID=A0A544QX33_9FIRM|nr:C39 family peptidase [Peptacetobacter hominis]TQQ85215.1 hypothetical protein EXD82_02100 [Peptacetobacter hominis]